MAPWDEICVPACELVREVVQPAWTVPFWPVLQADYAPSVDIRHPYRLAWHRYPSEIE